MTKKIDVYILAGFLGSGKTTLLQHFLKKEKNAQRKVAVLLNEIGEFSVDTVLLGEDTPLKELLRGCICCTIKDEVEIQMLSLYQEHQPDVIYIETTGVAHPMEVLDAATSPLIAPYMEMKGIFTVVDGKRWLHRHTYNNQLKRLLEEQVKYGEQIIINKSSQLTDEEKENIHADLSLLNPSSPFIFTDYSVIHEGIHSTLRNHPPHQPSHSQKDLRISTMSYTFSYPVEKDVFEEWLRDIPNNIYRIKGFLRFLDAPKTTYLFQYSYGVPLYVEERMKLPQTLVLIGSDLQKDELRQQLGAIEQDGETKLKNSVL